MESTTVKIIDTAPVTHNVKRFRLEKPGGLSYIPGQAAELSVNKPGWEEERRPFTITSLHTDDYLEFTIKIYPEHHGVTEQLGKLSVGDELIVHEPFGTISYKGPGVFIAAGTGITPFISILRHLKQGQPPAHTTLLFANRTERDIILRDELTAFPGMIYYDILSEADIPGQPKHIGQELLKKFAQRPGEYYYICGPDPFVAEAIENLKALGVPEDRLVFEQ
ncbi:MAG TPA: FAD-binding oxidoreductase [Mucilaginibacter sp.]|nr:FAD-binding oxidoreductase [Mucilaginibacter sp.]